MRFRHWVCCLTLPVALACSKKDSAEQQAAQGQAAPGAAPAALGGKQQSVGRNHLPEGCELVTTVDWQRFRQLKFMQQDLEREFAELGKAQDEDAKKVAEFLKKTGIDPLKDPGDIAICLWHLERVQQDATPGFVAIVGGNFRPGAAIEALDTVTARVESLVRRAAAAATQQKSNEPEVVQIAGVKALRDKESGVLVAQAKNGAFVIGNDQPRFERALSPGSAHAAYKLSPEPAGVALSKDASGFLRGVLAGSPFAAAAESFAGGHMGFDDRTVRLVAHFDQEPHAALVKQAMEGLLANVPPTAAAGAKVQLEGKVVSVEVPIPEEAINGMLQQLPLAAPSPGAP